MEFEKNKKKKKRKKSKTLKDNIEDIIRGCN